MNRERTTQSFARNVRLVFAAAALSAVVSPVKTAHGQEGWIRYYGNYSDDSLDDVSTDGLGNAYASGTERISSNGSDAILLKYDDAGNLQWTRVYGVRDHHFGYGVSADGLGNAYVAGATFGNFTGDLPIAYVGKFDESGTQLWGRELDSAGSDYATGVATDGLGSVYISGHTDGSLGGPNAGGDDAFLSKYDADGSLLWTKQFGTAAYDRAARVAVDGLGSVYTSGTTNGNIFGGGADALLNKFDSDGTLLWSRQLGTAGRDQSTGVSVDGLGNIYISGYTDGSLEGLNSGEYDAFLSKYDPDGTLLWTRQLGTAESDRGLDVSVDGLGNVFLSGSTMGSLVGPNVNSEDAFVSKFDAAGMLLWIQQLGAIGFDARGVAADGAGGAYIAGTTSGFLPGGLIDAYVARIVPEPGAATLAILTTPLAFAVRRRRSNA